MRLIDRDAIHWRPDENWELYATAADIRAIPIVDAVVVTRCKDCRCRGLICCPAVHETIGNGLVDYAVDDGYCCRGKPKED